MPFTDRNCLLSPLALPGRSARTRARSAATFELDSPFWPCTTTLNRASGFAFAASRRRFGTKAPFELPDEALGPEAARPVTGRTRARIARTTAPRAPFPQSALAREPVERLPQRALERVAVSDPQFFRMSPGTSPSAHRRGRRSNYLSQARSDKSDIRPPSGVGLLGSPIRGRTIERHGRADPDRDVLVGRRVARQALVSAGDPLERGSAAVLRRAIRHGRGGFDLLPAAGR